VIVYLTYIRKKIYNTYLALTMYLEIIQCCAINVSIKSHTMGGIWTLRVPIQLFGTNKLTQLIKSMITFRSSQNLNPDNLSSTLWIYVCE